VLREVKAMFFRRPISFVLGGVGVVSVLAWGVVKDLVPKRKTLTPARREAMRAATDEILKTCPVCFSLLATPVIRAVVDRESNRLSFALLASMTTIDVAAALAILYHSVATFFYIVVIGLLAIAAGWYNYWMCDRLEKNR